MSQGAAGMTHIRVKSFLMVLPDMLHRVEVPEAVKSESEVEHTGFTYGLNALWSLARDTKSGASKLNVTLKHLTPTEPLKWDPTFKVVRIADNFLAVVGIPESADVEEVYTFMESFDEKFSFQEQPSFKFKIHKLSQPEYNYILKSPNQPILKMKMREMYAKKNPDVFDGPYLFEDLNAKDSETSEEDSKIRVIIKSRVVIHREDNKFLFVNPTASIDYFSIPGGRYERDDDDNSRETAIREMKEELEYFLEKDHLSALTNAVEETESIYYNQKLATAFYLIKCPDTLEFKFETNEKVLSEKSRRLKEANEKVDLYDLPEICRVCWKFSGEDENTFKIPTAILKDINAQ